ncbi:MAG: Archaeal ATPase, partial [Mogibacterium sp.]|nr:Archaeal ATPase [Mogibacterium sp.]
MDDLIIGCKIPKPCRCFVGRESELDKLHQMLTANGMVFLHGIAGIGKSEMAKTYAWLRRKEYVNILYVMHSGDLESDIADLDFIDDRPEDDRQERFRKHNRLLRSLREDSLLIIDNYD